MGTRCSFIDYLAVCSKGVGPVQRTVKISSLPGCANLRSSQEDTRIRGHCQELMACSLDQGTNPDQGKKIGC